MRVLVTGGASSGKSEVAEGIAMRLGHHRVYVATMRNDGPEAQVRIERHRLSRADKGFVTVERSEDIKGLCLTPIIGALCQEEAAVCERKSVVLLECLGTLVSNELYGRKGEMRNGDDVFESVYGGVLHLAGQCDNLVVVTNEIGAGDTFVPRHLRSCIALQGRLNNALAACFDVLVEAQHGIPCFVKGSAV